MLRAVAVVTTALALACATAVGSATAAPLVVPGSDSPAEFVPGAGGAKLAAAGSARRARAADPWGWSAAARTWARAGYLPAAVVDRGPESKLTRGQFLVALAKIEAERAALGGAPATLPTASGAQLADVAPTSIGARAVALGWMAPVAGRFAGTRAITSNEASLAVLGMLGLRPSVVEFAGRLRSEVPGARATYLYASSQALVRTLGLRFNVLDPYDELELGPTEYVGTAHGAYMLHGAATRLQSWKLDEARRLAAEFELPQLGPNQLKVLRTAVAQLGQPYIWAGETEERQSEGHGGFDCSGFTIRVVNQSGIAAADIAPIGERTTYTQSALPAAGRIPAPGLLPGDAMFFGEQGPRSTPAQNYHAGVYMGNGWFIHSSGGNGGVAINRLDGWWGGQFAWGRRALKRA